MTASLEPHGAIGVGMGGSCPECRGPLDLGQDYCLECGTNVRVKKRVKRVAAVTGGPSATVLDTRRPNSGFPWVWFTVLLLLAIAALVSVLAYESSGSSPKHAKSTARTDTTAGVSSTPTTAVPQAAEVPTTPTYPATGAQIPAAGTQAPAAGAAGSPTTAAPVAGGTPTTPVTSSPVTSTPAVAPSTVNHVTGGVPAVSPPAHSAPVTSAPAASTPAASTPAASPTASTPTTPATGAGAATGTGGAETWPAGQMGYTVVLGSYGKSLYTQSDAGQRAAQARQHGLSAGVLDSDQYSSLDPGYWVVFSGDYTTKAQAQVAVSTAVKDGYESAYVRQVKV